MPHSADIEILLPDLSEAVTPQTIPHFWPPDSLDYRSGLILIQVLYVKKAALIAITQLRKNVKIFEVFCTINDNIDCIKVFNFFLFLRTEWLK